MKIAARLMLAAGAASLLGAPIAAQANTRAGDNTAVYSVPNAAPGLGRSDEGEEFVGVPIPVLLLGIITLTAVTFGVVNGASSNSGDASPGT